ncbi:MAG: hypothetical protein DME22_20710 [Verrucomicrobia bacterium]|nr:MAG: hypothetical protein DME22_20710 [Verrucomicrobiota bacterium]PYJ97482.1 MAG: hypothetical protein DME23_15310 [Verrucomicrobiota bacterium]
MNASAYGSLRNSINRFLDDEKCLLLKAGFVQDCGLNDWQTIRAALKEWESKGYLRILKDPYETARDEICVEMLSYIDRESPWPDWPPRCKTRCS